MKVPIHIQKDNLSLKAVKIQCLDQNKMNINGAYGSGFICSEYKINYLYTCWHLVTGYNMHNIEIGRTLPNRKFLKISLQASSEAHNGIIGIGGVQEFVIPLYDDFGNFTWIQDDIDIPHFELNNIGIKVPCRHDLVKLELLQPILVDESQLIMDYDINFAMPSLGDKIYIVGYPYGYSALGDNNPTPIVLTRFLSSRSIYGRNIEMLLDGPGAPGMSGGPIFLEKNNEISLIGIYTGLIFPDFNINQNEKTTSLGTFCFLNMWWYYQNNWPIPYKPT